MGCDIDQNALRMAEKCGIETKQVDLNTPLPFPDATFDVVVMAEVLEHLPYPEITLAEIKRVLKLNGIFIGSIPLAYNISDRIRVLKGKKLRMASDHTHLQFFKYEELINLLSTFFHVDEVKPLDKSFWLNFSHRLFAKKVAFKATKTARNCKPSTVQ